MRFPTVPDFRRKFGEMTLDLYVLRIIVGDGVRVLGPGPPGAYQKVDLPHVAP